MTEHEYEIKMLGDFDSLAHVFNALIHNSDHPVHEFDTIYFDDELCTLRNQGFALRFRPATPWYQPNVELKAIDGSLGGLTKRIEIGERAPNASFDELLSVLRAKVDPSIAKIPLNLRELFTISTVRSEKVLTAPFNDSVGVEIALDQVTFKHNGQVVGQDSELEIELKEFPDDFNPEEAIEMARPFLSDKVRLSTQSKFSRMMELLHG